MKLIIDFILDKLLGPKRKVYRMRDMPMSWEAKRGLGKKRT